MFDFGKESKMVRPLSFVAWAHDVSTGAVEVTIYFLEKGKKQIVMHELFTGEEAERKLLAIDEIKISE